MKAAIMIVLVMVAIGIIFGLVLAVANKKFAVKTNPLIPEVEEVLPKGQCGSCGYAGCSAYAEAVVLNPDVPPNLCVPGKAEVAEKVAKITGKIAEKVEPRVAHVRCSGSPDKAKAAYEYTGVKDCAMAAMLHFGPKGCKYGCIGFGTCVKACHFDALSLGENRLPVVDPELCTGCGACAKACPKKVIEVLPKSAHVQVDCSSREKGAAAKKLCTAACLGCGLCARNCPHGAIHVENNLAVVDHSVCAEKCSESTCTAKCPTGAIKELITGAEAHVSSAK